MRFETVAAIEAGANLEGIEMKLMMSKSVLKRQRERQQARAMLVLWGEPILKTVCEPVSYFDEARLIMDKLRRVLQAYLNGVGLSAPQVGHAKRVIAIFPLRATMRFMINPVINDTFGKILMGREECLSYPGITTDIARSEGIVVSYRDCNNIDRKCERFIGWEARIIQHELDHLDGKCKVIS